MASRSRSPDAARLARISRSICAMGRYAAKRPKGLIVDHCGAFAVKNLLECWGSANGFDETAIMEAVRQHMFHEDGSLRYSVSSSDPQGVGILVQVMPKRRQHTNEGGDRKRHRRLDTWRQHVEATSAWAPRAAEPQDLPTPPPAPDKSTEEKLDMSLDSLIRDQRCVGRPPAGPMQQASGQRPPRQGARQSVPSRRTQERRSRLNHACRQMGLTPDTKQIRARGSAAAEEQDFAAGSSVQKWLKWVFKAGHMELHIALNEAGAAPLKDVALAVPKHLGEFDGESLSVFIKESTEGAFELLPDGLVRPTRRAGSQSPGRRRGRSASSASSASGEQRDRLPAAGPGPIVDGSGGMDTSEAAEDSVGGAGAGSGEPGGQKPPRFPPAKPPGDGWTEFSDNGTFWWYYKGPLGEWWLPHGSDKVLPYGV